MDKRTTVSTKSKRKLHNLVKRLREGAKIKVTLTSSNLRLKVVEVDSKPSWKYNINPNKYFVLCKQLDENGLNKEELKAIEINLDKYEHIPYLSSKNTEFGTPITKIEIIKPASEKQISAEKTATDILREVNWKGR